MDDTKSSGAKETVFCILDAVKVCKSIDSHLDYRDITSYTCTECPPLRTTTTLGRRMSTSIRE